MKRFIVNEKEVFSSIRSTRNASNSNVVCSDEILNYNGATVCMYHNVYCFPLFVSIGFNSKLMEDNFYGISKETREPIKISSYYWDAIIRFKIALTAKIWSIKSEIEGAIIIFPNKENITIGDIAHEANHVSDIICDKSGVKYGTFDNGEAHAYITGWIGDCVANTIGISHNKNHEE
jgi:hypothetical protein